MHQITMQEQNVTEYPIDYDIIPGEDLYAKWRGIEVPVPPSWVREWSPLTGKYKYACLSNQLPEEVMLPEVRAQLAEYVKRWAEYSQRGTNLNICGTVSPALLLWAGAAILNEIVMRFGTQMGLFLDWFAVGSGLRWMVESRDKAPEEYVGARNRRLKADLLLMDDILSAEDYPEGQGLVRAMLDHRFLHSMPTLLILPFAAGDRRGWKKVMDIVGRRVIEGFDPEYTPTIDWR